MLATPECWLRFSYPPATPPPPARNLTMPHPSQTIFVASTKFLALPLLQIFAAPTTTKNNHSDVVTFMY